MPLHPVRQRPFLVANDDAPGERKKPKKDVLIATETHLEGVSCPEISFGSRVLALKTMDADTFGVACVLSSKGMDRPMRAEISAEHLQFDNVEAWSELMNTLRDDLLEKHGFKGSFELLLKGFTMVGAGASKTISPQAGEHYPGVFASVLVDLPFAYKEGIIRVTCESRPECFDFSSTSDKTISLICWLRDSTVAVGPISSGFRAFLLYDVIVDRSASLPLTLVPGSARMHKLERNVEKLVQNPSFRIHYPKMTFMPLVRVLVHTHKSTETRTPSASLEFYYHVVNSYQRTMWRAAASTADPDVSSYVREEGLELIWSFGGKTSMKRLLGQRCVNALIESIESFGH